MEVLRCKGFSECIGTKNLESTLVRKFINSCLTRYREE